MLLGDLIEATTDGGAVEITSLAYDTRHVQPGALFFCVTGFSSDGHDFAGDAVERGAAALVVEHELDIDVPQVRVESVRNSMGPLADRFFGEPSRQLDVVGVTGTNGKTTTAFLVRGLLGFVDRSCGLLGTVETIVGGERRKAVRTTPEAVELQALLREMADGGDVAAAIEVSSHALDLGRVDGTRFSVAMFTNLSQDHLDFHGSMESYWLAKRRLFTDFEIGTSVINVDDKYGEELVEIAPNPVRCSLSGDGDWCARDLRSGLTGSVFQLISPLGEAEVRSPLSGEFNVRNVLGAAAAAGALGVPFESIIAALGSAGQVPGRFQSVSEGQPYAVIVDYAHTPDSLENVLRAARGVADGSVLCVFGCGGDRDAGKRPLMGEIASRLADLTWITSDNPRSEDPEAIISQIAAGAGPTAVLQPDREVAIVEAIRQAQPGDVVVIAGKGHETGQEFADGHVVAFDDVMVARAAIMAAGGGC